MSNKNFAVIGHPIKHSISPFIHRQLLDFAEIEGSYAQIDVAPEDFDNFLQTSKTKYSGFNVTIPYKQKIIPLLHNISLKAKACSSVNTVKIEGGTFSGSTTDPVGFVKSLESNGVILGSNMHSVVILGCGGVAAAFAYEALERGCAVDFLVREQSKPKACALAEHLKKSFLNAKINILCNESAAAEQKPDLLINATPVGMHPNIADSPATQLLIKNSAAVFDAVYNPVKTEFIKIAEDCGTRAIGGLQMLVWQAAASQEIWNGCKFSTQQINQICTAAEELLTKQ
ncbi:MAG: shikimate dehydrogenase [Oscillospiraceae bacterium]|jgi:shikimate dehydrogenase|nr:shikimate dehydrogenase [Oscillospiraceae bacterium]